MATPTPDVLRRRQFKTNPTTVTIVANSTTLLSATLSTGVSYSLTADVDCFFLQGALPTATASSNPLWQKTRAEIFISTGTDDQRIAIFSSSNGTAYLTKME